MKKVLMILILAICGLNVKAQVIIEETNINDLDIKYVELVGQAKFASLGKIKVIVDYGQKLKIFKSQAIRSADGTKAAFNSMIDALNFMEANGWRFVSNYVIRTDDSNEVRYILKKAED